MVLAKLHKNQGKEILAICDSDLLGKKFEEGMKMIDLTGDFYNGQEMSDDEVGDLMRNAYIVNIVGEKSGGIALKESIIDNDHVKRISNIPYAQITNIDE